MIILSFDLGRTSAACIHTEQGFEYFEEFIVDYKDLHKFDKKVKELIRNWDPDLILAPYPTRHYWTILNHGKLLGIIEAQAGSKDIGVIETQDSTCKAEVLGNGNARKKAVANLYQNHPDGPPLSEHVYDAMMFVDWYLKSI